MRQRDFPHGLAGRERFLGDLCCRVVADHRRERGHHRETFLDHLLAVLFVGFDPDDALLGERRYHAGAESNRFQQPERHHRHHHVELEISRLATDRDRRVAADHVRRHLQHGLAHHGIYFARHNRRSRLRVRQGDLANAAARAGGEPAQIVGDFREAYGQRLQAATHLHHRVFRRLRLKMIFRLAEIEPGHLGNFLDSPRGKFRMCVDARADRRAAERQLFQSTRGRLDPLDAELDLPRVAAEFLSQANRRRVGQVRAADLHDAVEILRLLFQRAMKRAKSGQQLFLDRLQRRDVDRRRDHVVRRLAHVDVVVGMDAFASSFFSQKLQRAVGDDLVGVHVGGSAGTGLKNIHDKFLVELSLHDFRGGAVDRVGDLRVQKSEIAIGRGGRVLDNGQGADEFRREADAAHGKIFHRPLRLRAVVRALGHFHLAHGIFLDTIFFAWHFSVSSLAPFLASSKATGNRRGFSFELFDYRLIGRRRKFYFGRRKEK